LSIVIGAHIYDFDNDEPENEEEMELISNFLQILQEWGEFGEETEMGERVKAAFALTQDIKRLDECGFYVFGALQERTYKFTNNPIDMSVAMIRVIRETNPDIVRIKVEQDSESNTSS
jgi:hypothetical protein